jgi:hypothetical protein
MTFVMRLTRGSMLILSSGIAGRVGWVDLRIPEMSKRVVCGVAMPTARQGIWWDRRREVSAEANLAGVLRSHGSESTEEGEENGEVCGGSAVSRMAGTKGRLGAIGVMMLSTGL